MHCHVHPGTSSNQASLKGRPSAAAPPHSSSWPGAHAVKTAPARAAGQAAATAPPPLPASCCPWQPRVTLQTQGSVAPGAAVGGKGAVAALPVLRRCRLQAGTQAGERAGGQVGRQAGAARRKDPASGDLSPMSRTTSSSVTAPSMSGRLPPNSTARDPHAPAAAPLRGARASPCSRSGLQLATCSTTGGRAGGSTGAELRATAVGAACNGQYSSLRAPQTWMRRGARNPPTWGSPSCTLQGSSTSSLCASPPTTTSVPSTTATAGACRPSTSAASPAGRPSAPSLGGAMGGGSRQK
jgi:hypothetical protein